MCNEAYPGAGKLVLEHRPAIYEVLDYLRGNCEGLSFRDLPWIYLRAAPKSIRGDI